MSGFPHNHYSLENVDDKKLKKNNFISYEVNNRDQVCIK